MKRQARECYLVRLQRYGEDPETIMGSWHPDFRELMKRLRDRQLTLMARLTVLEVDVYNVLNGKLDELEREFGPVESGMVSWTMKDTDDLSRLASECFRLRQLLQRWEGDIYRDLVLHQETLPVPRRRALARRKKRRHP